MFLTGPSGAFNPTPPPPPATHGSLYYAAVDPGGTKKTLGNWWQANGFDPATGGANGNPSFVSQAYLNHNDLGFGRNMNCLKNGSNLACYVTNYGLPDNNLNNADLAVAAAEQDRRATVAMEFDSAGTVAPGVDERVQFYVYAGGVAASPRLEFADLDGFGPKPVPYLCMVCHGGKPMLSSSGKANQSRFREFDLPSFRYSGGRQWDYNQSPPVLNTTEFANFAKLNKLVRDIHPTFPIGDLIDRWYATVGSNVPAEPTPPPGWSTSPDGYHIVYGQSCRTCHIARDEGAGSSAPFVFGSLSGGFPFTSTSYAVCGSGPQKRRIMPNAVVTYSNFWKDTPRVTAYEQLVGVPLGTCKD